MELSPGVQKQLGASLRELLAAEVVDGLESGLGARLDALERQVLEALDRCSPGPAPPSAPPPALHAEPPCTVQTRTAAAQTPQSAAQKVEKGTAAQEEFRERSDAKRPSRELTFGPTARQRLPELPEKYPPATPEVAALRSSLASLRAQLGARDKQTTQLQRELKQCRQAIWSCTEEQRVADRRLRQILTEPTHGPRSQAEDILRLEAQVEGLSANLSAAKAQEMHWLTIAKRQRAFFLQTSDAQQSEEGMVKEVLKRHPAGEVFLPPPPTTHADYYGANAGDWPMEPQRRGPHGAVMTWDDDDDAATDEEAMDSEDGLGSPSPRQPPRRISGVNGPTVPSLPFQQGDEDDEYNKGSLLDRLPPMPSDTARSV